MQTRTLNLLHSAAHHSNETQLAISNRLTVSGAVTMRISDSSSAAQQLLLDRVRDAACGAFAVPDMCEVSTSPSRRQLSGAGENELVVTITRLLALPPQPSPPPPPPTPPPPPAVMGESDYSYEELSQAALGADGTVVLPSLTLNVGPLTTVVSSLFRNIGARTALVMTL